MSLSNWEGVFCALWTPTDEQGGLIESALQTNLEFLKGKGLRGLLVLGSTGEFPHLDLAVRKRLVEKIAENAGSLELIMNISDIRPAVVAELARFAKQMGVAAVSLLPPSFFPLAQEDLTEFFVRAAEAAQLPLFLYNFPERTGNRIALETVAAVSERVQLAGIKQSGNEFTYHAALVGLGREKGFVVWTGADTRLPEAMAMGVVGCVSGLSNAIPECVVDAFTTVHGGKPDQAHRAAERMSDIGKQIQSIHFPLDVAAAMEARGLEVGSPKSIVSAATRARYQSLIGQLRKLFREWQLT